ncbi:MAG: hypothetical protein DA405_04165 [Bacteroidetes bacterium]|nr:MAG: hypothetical protein DA405_04165 [Bacteroidota bacterium]
MVLVTLLVTIYLSIKGYEYYQTPLEERFYQDSHAYLKASGIFGQGLGVLGTLLILVGVVLYITAKKYGYLERFIRLRYLLEFHIFLCTVGPIMILFHTTFKFGGIVSIAFWSMVIVVASGVVGRYIYNQIPRTISGKELSLAEIRKQQETGLSILDDLIGSDTKLKTDILSFKNPYAWGPRNFFFERNYLKKISKRVSSLNLDEQQQFLLLNSAALEWKMQRRIARLASMQKLFKLWHVAHRPFALIMLIIVVVHIGATLTMGYTWIF